MNAYEKALREFLQPMVNENRLELLEKNLARRTRYLTVVLEDIYQPHNASAVLRTCDCFGIQDVHIIENRNNYELIPEVELGAAQWLSLYRYHQKENNTADAIMHLKSKGYRIVATTPHSEGIHLADYDISKGKTAVMFGTEIRGLSPEALNLADEYVKIPMVGFTESFNISVSAAITLYELVSKLSRADIKRGLDHAEAEYVMLQWIRNSINHLDRIERSFKKRYHQ